MSTINQLNKRSSLTLSDLLFVYVASVGEIQTATLLQLLNYIEENLNFYNFTAVYQRKYKTIFIENTPTSQQIDLSNENEDIHIIVYSASGAFDIEFIFPGSSEVRDYQRFKFSGMGAGRADVTLTETDGLLIKGFGGFPTDRTDMLDGTSYTLQYIPNYGFFRIMSIVNEQGDWS